MHTPGPWTVFNPSEGYRPGIDAMGGSFSIILFGNDVDDMGVKGRGGDEMKANARLIAAAPELLAALEEAVKWIETADATATPMMYATLRQSLAAIAKAEGNQP